MIVLGIVVMFYIVSTSNPILPIAADNMLMLRWLDVRYAAYRIRDVISTTVLSADDTR